MTDYLAVCLIHWLSEWLNDWPTDWLTDWLKGWPNDWLTDWLTGWLANRLTDLLADWLTGGRLTDCLADRPTGWLAGRLTDWLISWLAGWRTNWPEQKTSRRLNDWITNHLIDSLTIQTDCPTHWLNHCLMDCQTDPPTGQRSHWLGHGLAVYWDFETMGMSCQRLIRVTCSRRFTCLKLIRSCKFVMDKRWHSLHSKRKLTFWVSSFEWLFIWRRQKLLFVKGSPFLFKLLSLHKNRKRHTFNNRDVQVDSRPVSAG